MRRILEYLKPVRLRIAATFLIKFIGTVMDLVIPWILSHILDEIAPTKNISHVFLWGCVMFLCAVVAIVGNIIANRMAAKTARDTTQRIRHDLFNKILHISACQEDEFTVSSLVSRLTSDTYNVHQMLGMVQRIGVRAPILLIGGLVITIVMDPVLTLVLVALLPLIGLMVYVVSGRGIKKYRQVQGTTDKLVRTVQENVVGVRVIRALSKAEYERERCEKISQELYEKEMSVGATMSLTSPLMNIILNFGLAAVIVVGAFRVNGGNTQPGVIIAFLTYFTIILNAMLMITRIFTMYSKASASAGRIVNVLDATQQLCVGGAEDNGEFREYHVVFDHVSFAYSNSNSNSNNKKVLNDVSFKLKRGEMLGITGETGSGKSTIIALLLRLYDPDEGNIYIDGVNIKNIPEQTLHTMFGVTFQNDFIFADTLRENVTFGRDISADQLARAIACAQAEEIISEKTGGLDEKLTIKGANLSGGQKQRVLIARALAAQPDILILDDASSALDYKTDAALRKSLKEYYGNTTSIIISQRVDSVKYADVVIELNKGCVVQA